MSQVYIIPKDIEVIFELSSKHELERSQVHITQDGVVNWHKAQVIRNVYGKLYTLTITEEDLARLLTKVHNACKLSEKDFLFVYKTMNEDEN